MFMAAADGTYTSHSQKPHKVKFVNTDYSLFTDTDVDTEEEHIIADDDVDEDYSNDFLVQKFKLLAMHYGNISYDSILNYYHNCHKDPPSFGGPVSHKYILQGVLRI